MDAVNCSDNLPNQLTYHWFYQAVNSNDEWLAFPNKDSKRLEEKFLSLVNEVCDSASSVNVNGGRYDALVDDRLRFAVYWDESPTPIRRCSWFTVSEPNTLIPLSERFAKRLEDAFQACLAKNEWNLRVDFEIGSGFVALNGPDSIIVYEPLGGMEEFSFNDNGEHFLKRKSLIRGTSRVQPEADEPDSVENLVFVVHGIGSICDWKGRNLNEVLSDFREISLSLAAHHFKVGLEDGSPGKTEFLPISWHSALHGEATGIDSRLESISLTSIPKLRNFSNDTILDALFYTSPTYCQTIINTVGSEMNRLYSLFLSRNDVFLGSVSVIGHSLGSLILFDILANQKNNESTPDSTDAECDRKSSILFVGNCDHIEYPTLSFQPKSFFALGSPIAVFLTVRGVVGIPESFSFGCCKHFYNIFHPFDPIAYRIEPLIDVTYSNLKPVLIAHHKGRKRMHLELRENLIRVGQDIKNRVMSTWNTLVDFAGRKSFAESDSETNQEVSMAVVEENDFAEESNAEESPENVSFDAKLNNGHRIDYVLQETPIEFINEYIFALASHACYWESHDTVLLILSKLYTNQNS